MAQHMTTTELIRSRTLQEQFTAALTDLVLVDHGTGGKRHRAFTLAEIAALIAGGSLNPIVLEGSGGGQNFTLTIDHNSITCVKSATGGASVTTKIDFNGESILPTVNADTLKAKTLHGTTVEGQTYKLVIDTITEILGNLVIGASNDKKNVTIHGNVNLDGEITHDVNITNHDDVSANLNVLYGLSKLKSLQVGADDNKILEATATNGVKVYNNTDFQNLAKFSGNVSAGGIVVDCTSDTSDVIVDTKLAGIANDNAIAILYLRSGQVVNKGTAGSPTTITTQGNCALPFYRNTSTSTWIPMFVANWT
jgi:hypothetical protein